MQVLLERILINCYSQFFLKKLLLKGRRAAICPYDQFPTLQQLAVYDKSKLKLIDEPNAAILKQNMFVAMDKKSAGISTAFGGNAAHHVVEGSDPSALKSRELLKKLMLLRMGFYCLKIWKQVYIKELSIKLIIPKDIQVMFMRKSKMQNRERSLLLSYKI